MLDLKTDYNGGDTILNTDLNESMTAIETVFNKMIIAGKKIDKSIIDVESFTDADVFPIYTDDENCILIIENQGDSIKLRDWTNGNFQERDIDLDWASVDSIRGSVILGNYIYILVADSSMNHRVYRYSRSDITAGGTLMTATFLQNNYLCEMASDGIDLFFSNKAGGQRFGDDTTQIDVTDQGGGTFRYTYDGTGTAPLFLTNGMVEGTWIDVGGFTELNNNGVFGITAVTETYFQVLNPVGSELVTNGDFNSITGWNVAINWVYNAGTNMVDHSGTPTGNIEQYFFDIVYNKQYAIEFEVKNFVTGGVYPKWNFSTVPIYGTSNGIFSGIFDILAGDRLEFTTAGFGAPVNLSLDNISMKYAGGQATANATGIKIIKRLNQISQAIIVGTTLNHPSTWVTNCDNDDIDSFRDGFGIDRDPVVAESFFYGYNSTEKKLYKFNKTTGALVSSIDFPVASGKKIDFIHVNGNLLIFSEELNFVQLPTF